MVKSPCFSGEKKVLARLCLCRGKAGKQSGKRFYRFFDSGQYKHGTNRGKCKALHLCGRVIFMVKIMQKLIALLGLFWRVFAKKVLLFHKSITDALYNKHRENHK